MSEAKQYYNNQIAPLLEKIDAFLKETGKTDVASYCHTNVILSILGEVERAQKEFDATLFFVVVYGPLKAGKSTMVNALAHEYVSPVRLGSETTRRPSIVLKSKERGIDEYFLKDPKLDKDEAFHKVIDFLRGMLDTKELDRYVTIKSSLLNQKNIEEKLSKELAVEPLITVIRVPGGKFINDKTALIDMPGFDGSRSNYDNTPSYNWVIQRTDFLIFIQSSISGITNSTVKFLEEIEKNSKNPPKWLVQNFIDGKHWRNEDERRAEALRQLNETREFIMKELNLHSEELTGTAINLGKASDGIFEGNQQWLDDSKFSEFEDDLNQLLADRRGIINENNSLNNLSNTLRRGFEKILSTINELREDEKSLVEIDLSYRLIIECLNDLNYKNSYLSEKLEHEIQQLFENRKSDFLSYLSNDLVKIELEQPKPKQTKEEVNNRLSYLSNQLFQHGANKIYKGTSPFGSAIIKTVGEMVQHVEVDIRTKTETLLASLNNSIKPLGYTPVSLDFEQYYFDFSNIPVYFDKNPFTFKKKSKKVMLLFDGKFDGQDYNTALKEFEGELIQQISDYSTTYHQRIISSIFDVYCDQRRAIFVDKIAASRREFTDDMNKRLEAIGKTIDWLNSTKQGLNGIDRALEIAKINGC